MRVLAWIVLLSGGMLVAACASRFATLQPAGGPTDRALMGVVETPEGRGPFPVLVLLHGCGGPQPNGDRWAAEARAIGFMTVVSDQFTPLGITQHCTDSSPRLWERSRDTHRLVRHLQQRPDVQADRVFLMGFSGGAIVAIGAATTQWDQHDPPWETGSRPPRPRGVIALYGSCSYFPFPATSPVLLLLGGADDWTPPGDCMAWAQGMRQEPRPPRVVVLEGAHHSFDQIEAGTSRFVAGFANANRPGGFGATVGYSRAATDRARQEILAFLQEFR